MRIGPSRNSSYFVRHTQDIAVSTQAWQSLYEENRIAIHFPDAGNETNTRLDPASYRDRAARQPVEVFRVLNELGGFVWAQFKLPAGTRVKVGRVIPGSFECLETTWDSPDPKGKHGHCRTGDPTALKSLRLSDARALDPHEAQNLRNARPKGAAARWECIDDALERLVDRRPPAAAWKSLTTDQQETMCAEFLRSGANPSLPELEVLLARVGGSRAVIDVEGLARDGILIHAQVTLHGISTRDGAAKLEALRQIVGESHRVFFATAERYELRDDVHIVPISEVETWVRDHGYFQFLLDDMV